MSNLIKRDVVNLPQEVSQQSRSVYEANSSTAIRKISDKNVVVNSIHQSINRSIADKGVNMEAEDMKYLKKSVTDDILNDFSNLSLQDIQLCFKMGVRGNLGEYFGINVVTFYQWLKKYKEDILPQTFHEVSKFLPPAKAEEPQVDFKMLDLEKVNGICNAIDKYKQEKIYDFNDIGNIHYKFLKRNNVFDFSDEVINSTKEYARSKFVSELKNKNLELLGQGKSIQMIQIDSVMDKIEQGDKDFESLIDILHLKLLLKHFIINFSSKKKDLENFKNDLIHKIKLEYGK